MLKPDISIILPDLSGGGAERLHVHLANHWVKHGLQIEFVLMRQRGELLAALHPDVTVVDLGVPRIRGLLKPLVRYLRARRPAVVLAAMWPLTAVSVLAWILAGRPGRLVVSDHSQLSIAAIEETKSPAWLLRASIRALYPLASGVIAVSQGVKDDLCSIGNISPEIVRVIYNPTALGIESLPLPASVRGQLWGDSGGYHILSVGTLKRQKDHETLIRAFAKLPANLNARLTILGEGPLRADLETLIGECGVSGRVLMPGFVLDPYPWYRTADLFVLSSRWEGFGNVLVEALESGLSVVSTDCPSGPAEILDEGRFGRLVPCGSPEALATAIVGCFHAPFDPDTSRERAKKFSVESIAAEYLNYCLAKEEEDAK